MFNFKEELQKISEQKVDAAFLERENDISHTVKAFNDVVTKLLKKQGAMSMQVEEMYSILEEDESRNVIKELEQKNEKIVQTLITAADLVEDLYVYFKEYPNDAMAEQSELMWNTLCKSMTAAGLSRIADEHTPYNVQLNTIEGVTKDTSIPDGFISKVLNSGYQYNGRVYRKSTVLVNKLGGEDE